MARVLVGAVLLAVLLPAGVVRAHEGPPFPIVVDRHAGPYVISVWTDPDVGVGKFFVILQLAPGAVPNGHKKVQVCVRPVNGRLSEVCYPGTRQDLPGREQYYAEVDFDRQEFWQVRVLVTGPEGSGEVTAEVEATPPGFGAWDLLLYGFPFLLFGGLWAYAALRRRHAIPQQNAAPPVALPAGKGGDNDPRPENAGETGPDTKA